MADIDKAERRERVKRRQKLIKILELIMEGKIDSSKAPMDRIFNQLGPRQQYVSPKDRDSYSYPGYEKVDEMLALTPNV